MVKVFCEKYTAVYFDKIALFLINPCNCCNLVTFGLLEIYGFFYFYIVYKTSVVQESKG